jgi:hypothetical protein
MGRSGYLLPDATVLVTFWVSASTSGFIVPTGGIGQAWMDFDLIRMISDEAVHESFSIGGLSGVFEHGSLGVLAHERILVTYGIPVDYTLGLLGVSAPHIPISFFLNGDLRLGNVTFTDVTPEPNFAAITGLVLAAFIGLRLRKTGRTV